MTVDAATVAAEEKELSIEEMEAGIKAVGTGANRSPIPEQIDHSFQNKSIA